MMKVLSGPDSRVSLKFYLIDFGLSSSFSSASSTSPPRTALKRTVAFGAGNPALFESAFGKGDEDEDEDDDEDFYRSTPATKKSNTETIKYGFLTPFSHSPAVDSSLVLTPSPMKQITMGLRISSQPT